jgi:multidrug efflux pump subunit AcrB
MVDLDPERMFAKNISAADLSNAFNAQSLILPSGDAKMGVRDYNVRINNSPTVVEQLNHLPIKQVNDVRVYLFRERMLHP